MMVHSWTTQHVRLSYKDKISGKEGFLDPAVSLTVFKINAVNRNWQDISKKNFRYIQRKTISDGMALYRYK